VTEEEKKRLAGQSALTGLSVSEYMRRRFFGFERECGANWREFLRPVGFNLE
jgi:hypothetical protein